nr:unnamed protein product [Callosobruchus analis]
MVSLSIGSLKVAKLFSPMLILARLVLLQLTLIPKSDSTSQVHGCSSSLSFGHLYDGPGGMYSAITNSRNRRMSSTGRCTKLDDIVDERPKLQDTNQGIMDLKKKFEGMQIKHTITQVMSVNIDRDTRSMDDHQISSIYEKGVSKASVGARLILQRNSVVRDILEVIKNGVFYRPLK